MSVSQMPIQKAHNSGEPTYQPNTGQGTAFGGSPHRILLPPHPSPEQSFCEVDCPLPLHRVAFTRLGSTWKGQAWNHGPKTRLHVRFEYVNPH